VDPIRWRIQEFASIDSTNTWLAQRAADGDSEGLVARADFQTAGRGRLDRRWEAPASSSLLCSLLLRPPVSETERYLIPVVVSLSARAALVRLCGVRPQLKWPNDLIVGTAKLGGLLAEAVLSTNGELAVVVGIGINLTWAGPSGEGSTCIRDLSGVTLDPRAVLDTLLEELDGRLSALYGSRSEEIRLELRHALATLGQTVRVDGPRETVEGLALDVDDHGRLQVQTSDGVVSVDVGDITHLRVVDASTP
jgi:BirA family biotin operon repressor/biotin-[acetyl-CoA-carboxylase] ligase